jgi:beta-glucosidase
LRESLQIVSDTSADVRGFFHWTGVDNYEWNHGFDVQFGCFTRDREPRGSAELLRSYAFGQ